MNTFIIMNVKIVTEYGIIDNGFIYVKRGIIRNIGRSGPVGVHRSCTLIDGKGAYLMPGFIDIYNEQLDKMGEPSFQTIEESLSNHGITTVYHIVPKYDIAEENKWNELRRLGTIRHQFLSKLPFLNSYYMIGASNLIHYAPIYDSRHGSMQVCLPYNPTISDILKYPSMYIICSDSIDTPILECIHILEQQYRVPLEEAVGLVSINPAKALGIDGRCGSIHWGKKADLVLAERKRDRLEIRKVFVNGCMVYDKEEMKIANSNLHNSEGDNNEINCF